MTYTEDEIKAFLSHSPAASAYVKKCPRIMQRRHFINAINLAIVESIPEDYRKILIEYRDDLELTILKPHTIMFTGKEVNLINDRLGGKTFHRYVHDKALEE